MRRLFSNVKIREGSDAGGFFLFSSIKFREASTPPTQNEHGNGMTVQVQP